MSIDLDRLVDKAWVEDSVMPERAWASDGDLSIRIGHKIVNVLSDLCSQVYFSRILISNKVLFE